jgi:hypothetical protein
MPPQQPDLILEVLRAEHGDCLLLFHGQDIVLIDGGPPGVYDDTLKPRLDELVVQRGLPLFLRMVMVSHIDDDHVVGLRDMFAAARDRAENKLGPKEWLAAELWLNAFGRLTAAGGKASSAGVRGAAADALVNAMPGAESKAVVVSIPNGNALLQDAQFLGVEINKSVAGELVEAAEDAATSVDVGSGLTFTVLAPAADRLAKLRKKWEDWDKHHPKKDVQQAANVDRSVFNLSSIAVLARSGKRTLLLTGDARSDDVMHGLEAAKLLPAGGKPLVVDVLKMPHHGSIRNIDAAFLTAVHARNYVISANGRDGNPENETLKMIVDSRKGDNEPWTIWLTYGGIAGDGKPGLHERLSKLVKSQGIADKVRFAKPGERHTIKL